MYSHRIFSLGKAFDVPWQRPQYIGRDEKKDKYPWRGFLMLIDEHGHLYYANRRMEVASLVVLGETNLSKRMVAADTSPIRKASRSKIECVRPDTG